MLPQSPASNLMVVSSTSDRDAGSLNLYALWMSGEHGGDRGSRRLPVCCVQHPSPNCHETTTHTLMVTALPCVSCAGGIGPLLPYWDPLGFGSKASPETFARWRATEIKHGRIAMMATVGAHSACDACLQQLPTAVWCRRLPPQPLSLSLSLLLRKDGRRRLAVAGVSSLPLTMCN